jgi:hypothetical protein
VILVAVVVALAIWSAARLLGVELTVGKGADPNLHNRPQPPRRRRLGRRPDHHARRRRRHPCLGLRPIHTQPAWTRAQEGRKHVPSHWIWSGPT